MFKNREALHYVTFVVKHMQSFMLLSLYYAEIRYLNMFTVPLTLERKSKNVCTPFVCMIGLAGMRRLFATNLSS
jgi:hypothetical protein